MAGNALGRQVVTLIASAVAGSYLLGLAATVGLRDLGLDSPYLLGFVLTGLALVTSWLLTAMGVLVPIHRARAAMEGSDTSALRDNALVGPFLEKLGELTHRFLGTLGAVGEIIDRNSVALAETSHRADQLNRGMKALVNKGAEIAASSHAIAATSAQVSSSASVVADSALQAKEDSSSGQLALQETIAEMHRMSRRTEGASTSIGRLQGSSVKIEEIVKVIGEVADQINLLSLNAAIEAARAGDQGRGFAVVAEEVRRLAEKTSSATKEIYENVTEIIGATDETVAIMGELLVDVKGGVAKIEGVGERLAGILTFSATLSEQMQEIVQSAEVSASEVESISLNLGEMQGELNRFEGQMATISAQSMELSELGEGMHEQLVDLDLDTLHGRMFKVARRAADQVQEAFERAIAGGTIAEADLFDQHYTPIPGTDPQKYTTRFDGFADRVLPAIQEPVLEANPELTFAICTDPRGYVPTHNNRFAHPPTGDYDKDLVESRSKRIFDDATGSRCGSHTKKMLLQTYKRDTGEIMHDLSVPISVNGRHWGGFRMGYKA